MYEFDPEDPHDQMRVLSALQSRGLMSSHDIQRLLGVSQPSVSRLLQAMGSMVLVLGAGRATRYAKPQGIGGLGARQPLVWVHADGTREAWGQLSLIAGGRLHVQAEGLNVLRQGRLPWFLAPLRGEGFLGRELARRLALHGLPPSPERWSLEQQLFAALHAPDSPGAIVLGEYAEPTLPLADPAVPGTHDALAEQLARQLPGTSSAGGEQAKFLARRPDGQPILVKFSPPRGTPFGELWNDLLHAEVMALQLLGQAGVPVAEARVVQTARRTYLESTRFDRIGTHGRQHAVPVWAAHEAFVSGPYVNWSRSVQALTQQRRLPPEAAAQVSALQDFGKLIGNNDMHGGNLSLWVARDDVARGRFTLAPLYDMLPMRWRPNPHDELGPLPFTLEPGDLNSPARPIALEFWQRMAEHTAVSRTWRELAAAMALQLR